VSVLPLALPLFDLEPFHGSAVLVGETGVVILGASGAGKSTLSAALDARGCPFVADDTCAFDPDGNLWPGPAVLNPRADDLTQPVVGEYNGKLVRAPLSGSHGPARVGAVAVLDPSPGQDLVIRSLDPSRAFASVLSNARAAWFLKERRQALQLTTAAMLAELRVASVSFDPTTRQIDATADAILAWALASAP
jgi:hypothetical protein